MIRKGFHKDRSFGPERKSHQANVCRETGEAASGCSCGCWGLAEQKGMIIFLVVVINTEVTQE